MSEHTTVAPLFEQPQVEYRDVPGFFGYRVGDDGSVWSCRIRGSRHYRTGEWHRIIPEKRALKTKRLPHWAVKLRAVPGGKPTHLLVHRLVLEAFVGPCPAGMECLHFDGDPSNNRLGNLRWGTRAENVADQIRHGVFVSLQWRPEWTRRGSGHVSAKLTEEIVESIRARVTTGTRQIDIAREYGVHKTTICNIMKRKNWKHVP